MLELLYGARLRYRTACGVLLYRHSNALMLEASRRRAERVAARPGRSRSVHVMTAYAVGPEEDERPDLYEERTRFWWQPPDRLREEVEADAHTRTTVLAGELWWIYSDDFGAISNAELDEDERAQHGAGGGERFLALLDPSSLIPLLEVDEIERIDDGFRVGAQLRDDADDFHVWPFVFGGDSYELELDAASGVVRRLATFLEGREVTVTELTELVLDAELPADTFVFVPPGGVEVLPPEPARRREYSVAEAAAEAPFRLFYVPELPDGRWRVHVDFMPARERPARAAHVSLFYHRADGLGHLSVSQQPSSEGDVAWSGLGRPERVERAGTVYIVTTTTEDDRSHSVAFERAGTAIRLASDTLDVDELLRVAESLEPVASEPP